MLAEAGVLVPLTPQREACSLGSSDCGFVASYMCLNTYMASKLSVACKGLCDQGLPWTASTVTEAAEVGLRKLGGGAVSNRDSPGLWWVPSPGSVGRGNDLYFLLRTMGSHQRILKEGRKMIGSPCLKSASL